MIRWKVFRNNVGKLLAVLFLWTLTTCMLMISKGSTLLMVAQIRNNGTSNGLKRCISTPCERIKEEWKDEETSSAWMWILLIALIFPDIMSLIRSGFKMFTEGISWPDVLTLGLSAFLKIMQTIGMCFLFFIVLPDLSSAEASIITASVGFFPGLLKCIIDGQKKRKWYWFPVLFTDVIFLACQTVTVVL